MRTTGILLITLLLISGIISTGCTNVHPREVTYEDSMLRFNIQSDKAVPDAVREVAVFRLQGLEQVEIYRNADNFPLSPGDNPVTIPLNIGPGLYRCFIYTGSGTTRFPAVIRDFEVI
jgi:hypothetical protein